MRFSFKLLARVLVRKGRVQVVRLKRCSIAFTEPFAMVLQSLYLTLILQMLLLPIVQSIFLMMTRLRPMLESPIRSERCYI